MLKHIITAILALNINSALAAIDSEYTGTIKSIYYHERDIGGNYIGVELNENMTANPCGDILDRYVVDPTNLNDRHFSMLLTAHAAGKQVKILNSDATQDKKCSGAYSTFNFIQIM